MENNPVNAKSGGIVNIISIWKVKADSREPGIS